MAVFGLVVVASPNLTALLFCWCAYHDASWASSHERTTSREKQREEVEEEEEEEEEEG